MAEPKEPVFKPGIDAEKYFGTPRTPATNLTEVETDENGFALGTVGAELKKKVQAFIEKRRIANALKKAQAASEAFTSQDSRSARLLRGREAGKLKDENDPLKGI